MNKSLQLALSDTQGKIFELSVKRNLSSENFIKLFMTSEVAKNLDKKFNHLQWAGKEYVFSCFIDECQDKLITCNDIFDEEILYWIGYIYRYWNLYTGESSKQIYKIAPAKTMKAVYLMYHTMAPESAINRLKESYDDRKQKAQNIKKRSSC